MRDDKGDHLVCLYGVFGVLCIPNVGNNVMRIVLYGILTLILKSKSNTKFKSSLESSLKSMLQLCSFACLTRSILVLYCKVAIVKFKLKLKSKLRLHLSTLAVKSALLLLSPFHSRVPVFSITLMSVAVANSPPLLTPAFIYFQMYYNVLNSSGLLSVSKVERVITHCLKSTGGQCVIVTETEAEAESVEASGSPNDVDNVDDADDVDADDVINGVSENCRPLARTTAFSRLTGCKLCQLILNFYSPRANDYLCRCGDIETNPGPVGTDDGHFDAPEQDPDLDPNLDPNELHDDRRRRGRPLPKVQLQVVSQNVRGLGCAKKVRHLINNCYKRCREAVDSIFTFQETYVARIDLLKYLWRGEHYVTEGTGNSLGCITLVTAPLKIIRSIDLDQRGHILVLTKSDFNRAELIVVNAYAPNGYDAEKLRYFEELVEKIDEAKGTYNCVNVIVAGDLNLVFGPNEVKNRAIGLAEARIANSVKLMWQRLSLTDGWQLTEEQSYTWTSSRTGQQAFSTLDRVLFNVACFKQISKTADWTLTASDHAAVIAKFDLLASNKSTKPNLSRLDPRLLQDHDGRVKLDEVFQELFAQRSANWNPHVSLEYCKMCIRTAANAANGMIKAKYRDEEAVLNADINEVVDEMSKDGTTQERLLLLRHKLEDLRMLKRRLIDKIGTRLQLRTARHWYIEGELSNKYFFNLLNKRSNDETNVIINEAGTEVRDPAGIETEIRNFYKNLYESVPEEINVDPNFFRNVSPVDQAAADDVTRRITIQDLEATLATCADSSPGPDGIPYSYLKHFWADFGVVLVNAWHYSLGIGELPPSHQKSYLRLIPKAGKDSRVISNLRPITLSNTDHKLITKTYSRKMTAVIAEKIGGEQTAYIPGRLINDNVRAMLMTLDLANVDERIDGVIVSLDAKKAFDSVDHRYIRKCLEAFGLVSFIPIFNTLYKSLNSDIIINGKAVDGYSILKGVKQGDALSCILFIMCMEPLIRNLNENRVIERISSQALSPVTIPKSYGYADDVTIVAKRSNEGVQAIFSEYETFSKASGLVLNANKTEILCFNKPRLTNHEFRVTYQGSNFRLKAQDQVKINGILLVQDPGRREEANVMKVYDSMERQLKSWSQRNLTLLGRILIIKTFAMSQAIFLLQSMSISDISIKKLMALTFKYLWNKNLNASRAPDRIKRSIMMTPVKDGGFGMVALKDVAEALDLRAYGRLIASEHPFFKQIKLLINTDNFFDVKVSGQVDTKLRRAIISLNMARNKILDWPIDAAISSSSLTSILLDSKISYLLTETGRRSLLFFAINRRQRQPKIKEVTIAEFLTIERFVALPRLRPILRELVSRNHLAGINTEVTTITAFPMNTMMLNVGSISSKAFRESRLVADPICIYKLGPILLPGEIISWTNRLKKLTSTRHKNILLRVMHGDVFSNERLCRFGLRDSAACGNCPEQFESIQHRLIECNKAREAWEKLEEIKMELGLNQLSDLSLENLVGAKDRINKVELALQAELIHKLTTKSDGYCPTQLARAAVLLVCNSEKLKPGLKERFAEFKMAL